MSKTRLCDGNIFGHPLISYDSEQEKVCPLCNALSFIRAIQETKDLNYEKLKRLSDENRDLQERIRECEHFIPCWSMKE